MIQRIILILPIFIVLLFSAIPALAKDIDPTSGAQCQQGIDNCLDVGGKAYDCTKDCSLSDTYGVNYCYCEPSPVKGAFGKIKAPNPLAGLLGKDPTGAGAISQFLSNFIILFYTVAAIVLIFMLLWGAFEWMTSGGDKEKLSSAQKRIMHAIIGILLFAVAFAVIRVLGTFTGFKFFKGQNVRVINTGGIKFQCPDGTYVGGGSDDPDIACKGHGT